MQQPAQNIRHAVEISCNNLKIAGKGRELSGYNTDALSYSLPYEDGTHVHNLTKKKKNRSAFRNKIHNIFQVPTLVQAKTRLRFKISWRQSCKAKSSALDNTNSFILVFSQKPNSNITNKNAKISRKQRRREQSIPKRKVKDVKYLLLKP